MQIIENWRGHRVLAVPESPRTMIAMALLHNDLGFNKRYRTGCALCPACDTTDDNWGRCTNRQWQMPLTRGGCLGYSVIAEEYIPLVQLRLGEQT